jgi:predicted NBD/HSP70 family sugar kinase
MVYATVRARPGITRAQLARDLGLQPTTVNDVVQRLLRAERVIERPSPLAAGTRRRGRPSAGLEATAKPGHVGGVDFGHQHFTVGVGDTRGNLLGSTGVMFDVDRSVEGAMDLAVKTLRELGNRLGARSFDAIGVGVPQPLDPDTGAVQPHHVRTDWEGIVPRDLMAHRIDTPVLVDNDAVLGALAELRSGAGQGVDDFVYVKVASGVGAGLVLRGEIYRGSAGLAGEIGHIPIPQHVERCRCGARGCLEMAISTRAVLDHLAQMGLFPNSPEGLEGLAPDPVMIRILKDNGRILGEVLAGMVNLLAPSLVILGGFVGAVGAKPLAEGVRFSIDRHAHPAIARRLAVRGSHHGNHAEILGALQLAATAVE